MWQVHLGIERPLTSYVAMSAERMQRKRAGKGRSVERETKRIRVEQRRRPSSDNEASLSIHEDFRDDRSPQDQDKKELDYFPLAKSDKSSKKTRHYRVTTEQEKVAERSRGHRKHKSDRERKERILRSPSSPRSLPTSHKRHSIRHHVSSGRNSPHSYEGRHSQEHQMDRNPSHRYQLDRDDSYRHGDHSRYPKDYYEGRRGSAPSLHDWRAHRGSERTHRKNRSPYRDEARKHGGREERGFDREERGFDREERGFDERGFDLEERGYDRNLFGDDKLRGRSGYVQQQRKKPRRELSPLEGRRVESSSEESSTEEREGPQRVITLHPDDFENFLKEKESSRSSSESSEESPVGRERGQRVESRERGGGRLKGTGDTSSYSSESGGEGSDAEHDQSLSKSLSSSESHSPESGADKVSLMPHVMRSKFDSEEEEEEEDAGGPHPLSPGYQRVLSNEESSNDEATQKEGEEEEAKKEDEMAEPSTLFAEYSDEELDEEETTVPCYYPGLMGCRNVECYKWLNRIEEGTYGVVHRAKDIKTGEIVALKKLKMEKEREGFPITSLREINMLLKAKHPNIVHVKEIVVGDNMDKIFIVMEYVEHDLKALMETMQQPFTQAEVKTLMIQLLRAVHHLHDNWILHRDLKASNLLLSHKGILKVGDFGLAREYGSPLKNYTPVVVTLWYRAPELLLGAKEYSTAVDMWSVGCIFAEFLLKEPLFRGRSEIDQINLIFKELGSPNERIWPGYSKLPTVEKVTFTNHPYNVLRKRVPPAVLTEKGFNMLHRFLTYYPVKRITALEALDHEYFKESPKPLPPSMFPTWPAKSEMSRSKRREKSPKPPEGGANTFLGEDEKPAAAFNLKF